VFEVILLEISNLRKSGQVESLSAINLQEFQTATVPHNPDVAPPAVAQVSLLTNRRASRRNSWMWVGSPSHFSTAATWTAAQNCDQ